MLKFFNFWSLKDSWKSSKCTCPHYSKNYICKHIIAIAAVKELFQYQDSATQIPIGQKRKIGRPLATKPALERQPHEHPEYGIKFESDQSITSDSEPEPQPPLHRSKRVRY